MVEHQGPRRLAACQIIVHGMQDVTDRLHPYLISVQTIDNIGGAMDECHIELDDRNAELIIPPDGVKLSVLLGWSGEGPRLFDSGRVGIEGEGGPFGQGPIPITKEEIDQEMKFGGPGLRVVFEGWVTECESGFGRKGGGRRLWITGKGGMDKGPAKEGQSGNMGEGKPEDGQEGQKIPLKDMMGKVFGFAGLQVAISPSMEKIARDYWHINDSAANFGNRIANEVGGLFKITGDKAIMTSKTDGQNATGQQMPTIEAIWGINLIGWRIKPFASRPQYNGANAKFFDLAKGAYENVKKIIGGSAPFGGADAIMNMAGSVVDKTQGEQSNTGTEAESEHQRGIGWVLLNGEPNAKAAGSIVISGARPGVDGTYFISEVEHNYTRGVGFTTRCNVKMPQIATGYETWKQNTGAPILEPGDPGFIGPMPWPDPPQQEQTYTLDELQRWKEIERLREESLKARTDGLIPITREELGPDGKVPDGYVLVGPPPEPPIAPPGIAPPISGDQTFTAEDMELVRQGRNEELARQRLINQAIEDTKKELATADAARQEEIKKEIGDLLDLLKPGNTQPLPLPPLDGSNAGLGLE